MPKKKYLVSLSASERAQLEQLLRGGQAATRKVTRARILLKASEGWTDQLIAEALSIGRATRSARANALSRRTSRRGMSDRAQAQSRSSMRRLKPV